MFTGIIEEIGTIKGIKRGNRSVVLEVKAKKVLEDLNVGDSIAGKSVKFERSIGGTYCFGTRGRDGKDRGAREG